MNKQLISFADSGAPKIKDLNNDDIKAYKTGLKILGLTVCEEFLDLPKIDLSHKYENDGLFYEIPFLHSEVLWTQGNQWCLLVVYEVKNRSSQCPLRIDFKYELTESGINYWLYVYDQGDKTVKLELVAKEEQEHFTTIHGYETIKLSELIGYKREC